MKHKEGMKGGTRGQWMKHKGGVKEGTRGQWMKHKEGMKGVRGGNGWITRRE